MRFFIVILNYCSWQDTLECIDSLSKSSCSDFNIIVIDNASPNNSVSRIEDYFNCLDQNYVYDEKIRFISIDIQEGWVGANKVFESIFSLNKGLSLFKYPILFLKSNKNLGFAGGNNLALNSLINSTMISDRDKVFLLNPDTTVAPNAIEKLVLIDDDEFVAACKIKNYQTRKDEFLGCYTLNPYLGSFRKVVDTDIKIESVDYIYGGALLTSIQSFRSLGSLPLDYFLYWEETDWSYNAKRNNLKFILCVDAIIYDKVGTSIGRGYLAHYYYARNGFIFYSKYFKYLLPCFLVSCFAKGLNKLRKGEVEAGKGYFHGIKAFFLNERGDANLL